MAYNGNVVEMWEFFVANNVSVDLGSDQTSLHNPFAGGYYPADIPLDEAKVMMAEKPEQFREAIAHTLQRHVNAINIMHAKGMYFFDYCNIIRSCPRSFRG
jgi:urocanate hydratase